MSCGWEAVRRLGGIRQLAQPFLQQPVELLG
jgi:hypothetical protein